MKFPFAQGGFRDERSADRDLAPFEFPKSLAGSRAIHTDRISGSD